MGDLHHLLPQSRSGCRSGKVEAVGYNIVVVIAVHITTHATDLGSVSTRYQTGIIAIGDRGERGERVRQLAIATHATDIGRLSCPCHRTGIITIGEQVSIITTHAADMGKLSCPRYRTDIIAIGDRVIVPATHTADIDIVSCPRSPNRYYSYWRASTIAIATHTADIDIVSYPRYLKPVL